MGFQDVVFLPSRACFSTTFLKNCGRGDSLRTTTCLRNVDVGKQVLAHCKIFLFQQSLFFVSVLFHGHHKTVVKLVLIWPASVLWILADLRQVSVCLCNLHFLIRKTILNVTSSLIVGVDCTDLNNHHLLGVLSS